MSPEPQRLKVLIGTGPPEDPQSIQNWALAEALKRTGHRVCLVVDPPRPDLVGRRNGFWIESWTARRPLGIRDWIFFWNLLGSFRPDVVLGNFFSLNLSILLSRLRGVPVRVAWYRSVRDQALLDFRRPRLLQRLVEWGKRLVYHQATHVVPVSRAAREDALRSYGVPGAKCTVFRTCRPDPLAIVAHRSPRSDSSRRIAFIGRLEPSKGVEFLVRAIAALRRRNPSWKIRVEVIGEGPERPRLEALADRERLRACIRFTGRLPFPEALERMAASDVLVVPPLTEAGPGVVPEALGLGIPLVVSRIAPMIEHLSGSGAAIMVPAGDSTAVAEALETILGKPKLRERMGRSARELFLSRFRVEGWVQGVRAWLLGVTG